MKLKRLKITDYRTLEAIDLVFPSSYTAICGPNDCGKTSVVRAIRALTREDSPALLFEIDSGERISIKDDYPKWKDTKPAQQEIELLAVLSVENERDAGLFQFLIKQLSIKTETSPIDVEVKVPYRSDLPSPTSR